MEKAKLRAKRTPTSLSINKAQTSNAVSILKHDTKSPFPFSAGFTVSAFVSTACSNENLERLRGLFGLDRNVMAKHMYDSLSDFSQKMKPRDALDLLALEQLYLHHLRALSLCAQASNESDIEKAKTLHEAADCASNTFRRLMQSFDERRKAPRQSIVTIGQTNVAKQQVVQNIQSDRQKKLQTN